MNRYVESRTPSRVRAFAAAALAALLVACDSGPKSGTWANGASNTTPQATQQPSTPPTELRVSSDPRWPHAISGQVFDAYSGVVGKATVVLFVEIPGVGFRSLDVSSDENGVFTVSGLPDSRVSVMAWKSGFVQPCAVTIDLRSSLALQVEVTSLSTLDSLDPPRPQSAHGTSLTGMVFETVDGGKYPIAGAEFWAEEYDDRALATTRSDLQGRYFLCNLPRRVALYVSKPGNSLALITAIDASQSPTLDIELKRR